MHGRYMGPEWESQITSPQPDRAIVHQRSPFRSHDTRKFQISFRLEHSFSLCVLLSRFCSFLPRQQFAHGGSPGPNQRGMRGRGGGAKSKRFSIPAVSVTRWVKRLCAIELHPPLFPSPLQVVDCCRCSGSGGYIVPAGDCVRWFLFSSHPPGLLHPRPVCPGVYFRHPRNNCRACFYERCQALDFFPVLALPFELVGAR